MNCNYNECTTKALEEEMARLSEQYQTVKDELKKRKVEEEERKRARLAADRQNREQEIRDAKKKYDDLVQLFVEDYGSYDDMSFWSWFARR